MLFSILKISWAAVTLLYAVQMIHSAPCRVTLVTPRNVVEKVSRSGWLMVRGNTREELQERLNIRPRQRRSINQTKSLHCSWTVELDEDVNRKPRFLPKAVCKGCPRYCRPVDFDHRVLVRDCSASLRTHKEKMDVWKWEKVMLPVAFVFDP